MNFLWISLLTLAILIFGTLIMRLIKRSVRRKKAGPVSSSGTLQDAAKNLDLRIMLKLSSHFDSNFNNIDRPFWQVANEGIVVKFTKDETPHFVYYKLDGEWNYTLRSFNGEVLPEALSKLVRAKFRLYAISCTEEIVFSDSESKTYILHLHQGNKYKQLIIDNNEMIVINEKEL